MTVTWYSFLLFTVIGLDRLTKWLALAQLMTDDRFIFPGFNLSLTWNRGISWGLFHSDSPIVFWGVTALIVTIILGLALYTFYGQFYQRQACIFWEVLVLGGAISNVIDRILYGAVVDFIQLYVKNFYWPTFNVADMFVVIGIVGMFFKSVVGDHDA